MISYKKLKYSLKFCMGLVLLSLSTARGAEPLMPNLNLDGLFSYEVDSPAVSKLFDEHKWRLAETVEKKRYGKPGGRGAILGIEHWETYEFFDGQLVVSIVQKVSVIEPHKKRQTSAATVAAIEVPPLRSGVVPAPIDLPYQIKFGDPPIKVRQKIKLPVRAERWDDDENGYISYRDGPWGPVPLVVYFEEGKMNRLSIRD